MDSDFFPDKKSMIKGIDRRHSPLEDL